LVSAPGLDQATPFEAASMTHPSNSTDTDYVDCFDIKAIAARVHAALFPEIPIDAPIKTLADFELLRAEQAQTQAEAQVATTQAIPPQSPAAARASRAIRRLTGSRPQRKPLPSSAVRPRR
jgi:hypothetical protein